MRERKLKGSAGVLDRLVLQLNATYEPISLCSARHAIILICKGAAICELASKYFARTPSISLSIPSVIRMVKYRKVPRMSGSVSRKGILLRDDMRCGYCGQRFNSEDLTLDHVIPKSRGGQFTWENIVASCFPDNSRKDNRTPNEAGMTLLKKPMAISIHSKLKNLTRDDAAWAKYLFY